MQSPGIAIEFCTDLGKPETNDRPKPSPHATLSHHELHHALHHALCVVFPLQTRKYQWINCSNFSPSHLLTFYRSPPGLLQRFPLRAGGARPDITGALLHNIAKSKLVQCFIFSFYGRKVAPFALVIHFCPGIGLLIRHPTRKLLTPEPNILTTTSTAVRNTA